MWALIDATDSATLHSEHVAFAVVDSTQTKVLEYRDHFVPESRITKVENYDEWRSRYRLGLRTNGSLALGVAKRCCDLLDNDALTTQLDTVRDTLDSIAPADADAMSTARAQASLFAMQAATALVAKTGGTLGHDDRTRPATRSRGHVRDGAGPDPRQSRPRCLSNSRLNAGISGQPGLWPIVRVKVPATKSTVSTSTNPAVSK